MPKPNTRSRHEVISEAFIAEGLPPPAEEEVRERSLPPPPPRPHRRSTSWKKTEPPESSEPPPNEPASTPSTPPPSEQWPDWMPTEETYPDFLVETCERMLLCLRIEQETIAMDSMEARSRGLPTDPTAPLGLALLTIAENVCRQFVAAANQNRSDLSDLLVPPSGLTDPHGNPL